MKHTIIYGKSVLEHFKDGKLYLVLEGLYIGKDGRKTTISLSYEDLKDIAKEIINDFNHTSSD